MKIYFFSNVDMGFGSPQFLYLLKNIKKLVVKSDIEFIAPYSDLIGSNGETKNLLTKRLYRNRNYLRCLYILIIIRSYFQRMVVIETYPAKVFNFLSKKTIIISYYHEIWSDIDETLPKEFDYFSRVKLVIAPQKDRARLAKKIYYNAKIFIVENCQEMDGYVDYEKTDFKPVLLYQGQIGHLSNAKQLLEIISRTSNIDVHLAGPVHTDYKEQLRKIIDSNERVTYHGILKNQELFALRQRASIGLVTWTNENLSTKFAAPTKLYDYISEGMYVVSFPNYSMTNLNNKYNFGYIAKEGDDINSVISQLTERDLKYYYYKNKELFKTFLHFEAQVKDFMNEFVKYTNKVECFSKRHCSK